MNRYALATTGFVIAAAMLPTITFAASPTTTDSAFVCPVISTDAVLNSPKGAVIANGDYTIVGPHITVPVLATNADGAGSPGGTHSAPGDSNYTAVWSGL